MRQRATSVPREATPHTYSIFTRSRLQDLWSQFGAGYFAQGHADLLAAQETQFLHTFRLSKTSKIKWGFNELMVCFMDKDAEELALVPGDAFQEHESPIFIETDLRGAGEGCYPQLNSTAKEGVGVC